MPRTDFTVISEGNGINFGEGLVAGSLSGSGTRYLSLSDPGPTAGLRRFFRNGISLEDAVVEAFHRVGFAATNTMGGQLLARIQSQSPLTGYVLYLGGTPSADKYILSRFNSGTETILAATAIGSIQTGVIYRSRIIVKGPVLTVQRFVSGVWQVMIQLLDPSPITGSGGVGFGVRSSGAGNVFDFDDWSVFRAG